MEELLRYNRVGNSFHGRDFPGSSETEKKYVNFFLINPVIPNKMKCCDYGTKSGNILILKNIPLTNLSQTIFSFSFTETSFDVIKDYFII